MSLTKFNFSIKIPAAHCILPKQSTTATLPSDVLALFGAHNLSNAFETGRIQQIPKKIYIHDEWNHLRGNYDADVSLLEFDEEKIQFSVYIQPICLWDLDNTWNVTDGIVTGWGKSRTFGKAYENLPASISAPIQTNEHCFLATKALVELSSLRTFCAGLRNGSGVCNGDSGGGLFIKTRGVFHLKGIVSSSLLKNDGCDVSKFAIYTNVTKFRSWIDTIAADTLVSSVSGRLRFFYLFSYF